MSGTDYTLTTNLGLYKPLPSADINQWGSHLNLNADTLDNALHSVQTAGPFLPLAGGTLSGQTYCNGPLNVNNTLQAFSYTTPGNFINPGATNATPVNFIFNWSGAYTGGTQLASVYISTPTDTLDGTGGGGPTDLLIRHNIRPGAKGGRSLITAELNIINGNITGDATTQQYAVANFWAQASANVGGTDTGNNSRGYMYGSNPQTMLHSGATNWSLVNGLGEIDIAIESGASVADLMGGSIILLPTHKVPGSRSNTALAIGAQPGAVPTWAPVLGIGGGGGPWPIATSGGIIQTTYQTAAGGGGRTMPFPPQLATYGIDVSTVNFSQQSGYAFRSPAFSVDGTGQINMSSATLSNTGTGIVIDIPNQIVTTAAVAAGGGGGGSGTNDYYAGDLLYDAHGGQYRVSAVTAGGVNGIVLLVGAVAASPPSNPVAAIGGSGIGCTLTLTWSARNTLSLNPTGKQVLTNLSAAATDAAAATAGVPIGGLYNNAGVVQVRLT